MDVGASVVADVTVEGVGSIVLARPAKRNAINHEMVDGIERAFERFAASGVGVVVLSGNGGVFSAGADLTEIGDAVPPAADRLQALLVEIDAFVVGVLDGAALGAGVSVLATCPLVLASTRSEFVLPERALGVFPAGVVGYMEPQIGARAALQLGLVGGRLSAAEALELGLVNELHDVADLAAAVRDWTALLAAEPGVARTASAVWRSRFSSPEFLGRKAMLDRLQVMPARRRAGGGS